MIKRKFIVAGKLLDLDKAIVTWRGREQGEDPTDTSDGAQWSEIYVVPGKHDVVFIADYYGHPDRGNVIGIRMVVDMEKAEGIKKDKSRFVPSTQRPDPFDPDDIRTPKRFVGRVFGYEAYLSTFGIPPAWHED